MSTRFTGWLDFVKRSWFQTFVSGLVLFYMVQQVLMGTQNPNFVPTLLLLGAFLTPVAFVTYVYERQPVGRVPLPIVAVCFFWGGAVGTVLAGLLEFETLRRLGPLALLGVGLIEEAAKLVFPLAIFLQGRYRLESEGLLFGVAAGMGFAALETMGYGLVALLGSQGNITMVDTTLLVRGIMAPAGHAAWTGLVCAVAWRERQRAGHVVLNGAVLSAFVVAILLHVLWDALLSISGVAPRFPLIELIAQLLGLAVALTSLSLLIRRLREARRLDGAPPIVPNEEQGEAAPTLLHQHAGRA
jgi:protease PrsW